MAKKDLLDEQEEETIEKVREAASQFLSFDKFNKEILPKILAVEKKCDFLISHYGLEPAFKKFLGAISDDSYKRQMKSVCEFYGISAGLIDDVTHWEKMSYIKQEHLDIVITYFQYKSIPFNQTDVKVVGSKKSADAK